MVATQQAHGVKMTSFYRNTTSFWHQMHNWEVVFPLGAIILEAIVWSAWKIPNL